MIVFFAKRPDANFPKADLKGVFATIALHKEQYRYDLLSIESERGETSFMVCAIFSGN